MSKPRDKWRNRIVGHGEESPSNLLAHPDNYRIHTLLQQDGVEGSLEEVGWVQSITVNKRTGFVVNGHLRITLALRNGAKSVPVEYVDLSPTEEATVLAVLDASVGYAEADPNKLDALLREVSSGSAGLQAMISQFAEDSGAVAGLSVSEPGDYDVRPIDTRPPPKMAWVLIGIPTVQYGLIAEDVVRIACLDGVICETVLNDGPQDR